MVRFIKLIEDEFKGNNKGNLKDQANLIPKKSNSLKKGNIKKVALVNIENDMMLPLGACRKSSKVYKAFYLELILIARSTLEIVKNGKKINSRQIKDVIQRLVSQFKGGYCYNHLISYTYLHTSDNFIISHMVNCAILTVGFSRSMNFSNKDLVKSEYVPFYMMLP